MYFKTDVVKHKVSFSYFYLLFYVGFFYQTQITIFCDSFTEKLLLASNFFICFLKSKNCILPDQFLLNRPIRTGSVLLIFMKTDRYSSQFLHIIKRSVFITLRGEEPTLMVHIHHCKFVPNKK
jgi:hypothetical protein